jgi:general secretion pathway protein B
MSFILDALKKSESDRQRQGGPALFEVRVAPPRTRLPTWAIAIALLLVLNLGVVLWMLLRHQGHLTTPPTTATHSPVAASTAPPASAPATSAPMAAGSAPPVPMVAVSSVGSGATAPPASTGAPSAPAAAAAAAPSAPSATPSGEPGSAEDYAPAEDPVAPALGSHVRRGTASGLPLYQELTSTPGTALPQLRLDLHVFAARPEERFVMVNMHKLREGDTLPEGVRLDSITPEGAVMTYNGTRFLLPRD